MTSKPKPVPAESRVLPRTRPAAPSRKTAPPLVAAENLNPFDFALLQFEIGRAHV